jgi:hypothetical protein
MYYVLTVETQDINTVEVPCDNENDIFCSVSVHENAAAGHN